MAYPVVLLKGMFRSRRLLDLAHKLERCTNCGRLTADGCEPAHSNLQEHGRGKDNKAHDCFYAALCHACHAWLDFGINVKDPSGLWQATREQKREMFIRAMHQTWLNLFKLGWIGVAP